MAEEAPGIFVTDRVPAGTVYVMDLRVIQPEGPERGFAINPTDWGRIPGAERERFFDDIIRRDAQRGLARIESLRPVVDPPKHDNVA